MAIARTRRRVRPVAMWVAVAAAIAVHGAVLVSVRVFGVSGIREGLGPRKAPLAAAVPELKPTCRGDALLAGSARVTMCFAPWRADTDACFDDAWENTLIDLSSCEARNASATAVAMLEPRMMNRVKPIDPEPLLEMTPPPPPKPKPEVVPPPHPNTPRPPPPPAKPPDMQVVETARPSQEEAPDHARFLSEYNTKVKHQTVARGAVKEPMIAKSRPAELTPKENPRDSSVQHHAADRPPGTHPDAPDVPGALSMRSPGLRSPARLDQEAKTRGKANGATGPLAFDGFVPRRGNGEIEQQAHQRSESPTGQGGAGGGAPRVPNLKPSKDVLERALGGGSVDHLKDVDSGDETALSSKRWIFASFFNRLKRQVAQNWDPASVWRRSDPTGQVYGFKTRVTKVRVTLTRKGELAKIVVTGPSGVTELDDEAVRSFHAAAPFPNPPKELASPESNEITFDFSFYFEIGASHTTWSFHSL